MGIRNTIPLKEDICAGTGKFSVYQEKESSDSRVAIVHSDAVEFMILDKKGSIVQQQLLEFDELFVDNKPDDIQVLWCDEEPKLIIAHTNHLLRVIFDCSTKTWKADINRVLDEEGWITSLASKNGHIYTGSNEGIWELNSEDMLDPSKLTKFSASVICVSEKAEYLAAGDDQGGINLFSGGPKCWSQVQRIQKNKSTCCTSMLLIQEKGEPVLLAALSTGSIHAYLLPTMDCLSETAAHIRWITQIVPVRGGFVSASEDGYLHLWTLGKCNDPSWDFRHMTSFELKDCMITAAAPLSDLGVFVTAYDRPCIFCVTIGGRQEEEDDTQEDESIDTNYG